MTIEDLPHYIEEDIEFEDGSVEQHQFYLDVSRDSQGKWACGYVHFCTDAEIAIPQLVIMGSDNLNEVAIRMNAKLKRYNKAVTK